MWRGEKPVVVVSPLLTARFGWSGHWQEVAFPKVDKISGCYTQCQLHPEATAMQYNYDGYLLQPPHTSAPAHCSASPHSPLPCRASPARTSSFPSSHSPHTSAPLFAHPLAVPRPPAPPDCRHTESRPRWCGCLALKDTKFSDAIKGKHIHGEAEECTICGQW